MIPNLILLAQVSRQLNTPYDSLVRMLKRGEIAPDFTAGDRYKLFKPESVQRIGKLLKEVK